MQWNVLELAENGRYLKLYRGFLVVMQGEKELGRVVIDELNCVLLTAQQISISKPVMVRLAEHSVPVVICGTNFHPLSLNLPYAAHHRFNRVLAHQLDASLPLKKQLWKQLVQSKIRNQLWALQQVRQPKNIPEKRLKRLANQTRSGDPMNTEAQAARVYWEVMLGKEFRRRSDGTDFLNSALNYGYSIIRAACARAVVAAGLLPALGLHHSNQGNPFCLVDDLMEIYRPLIDMMVCEFDSASDEGLFCANKQRLASNLGVLPEHWTRGMLGFPPTEENQHEEEQIYR